MNNKVDTRSDFNKTDFHKQKLITAFYKIEVNEQHLFRYCERFELILRDTSKLKTTFITVGKQSLETKINFVG